MSASSPHPHDGLPHAGAGHRPEFPGVMQWDGQQWVQVPFGAAQPDPAAPWPAPAPAASSPAPAASLAPVVITEHPVPLNRDPQRTALAALITFVAAMVGLWAILGYMHDTAAALSSVSAGNDRLVTQLEEANTGLAQLDGSTSNVVTMREYSGRLAKAMSAIDADMAAMVGSVEGIGTQMQSTNTALDTLVQELDGVGTAEADMEKTIAAINGGLAAQDRSVTELGGDLAATSRVISQVPSMLRTTNERLSFINRVVCQMGTDGLVTKLALTIEFIGIPTGRATIFATMIPPGGWTC